MSRSLSVLDFHSCNMKVLISTIFALFFLPSTLHALCNATNYNPNDNVSRTINVDKTGHGDFTTVKQAIDSIPSNNNVWTRIFIRHGIYFEKVVIPKDKPYIILEGHPKYLTAIIFGDNGTVVDTATIQLKADNFIARNILFKNSYDHLIKPDAAGKRTTWAPAASIDSDKASFYNCTFISLQDTLFDYRGRHFFYGCNIQGAIDFIWGNGQSIYEKCQIVSLTDKVGFKGYITAQGREEENQTTGFVFKNCRISGSGPILLGRAYRTYSRVLFAGTYMENMIISEGWSEWNVGNVNTITFSEANCSGPGANMSRRVPWEKKLSDGEIGILTNVASFIDQDGWLGKQPH